MDERTELELAVNANEAAVDEAVHKLWLNKELLAPLFKAAIPEDSIFEYIDSINRGQAETVKKYIDIESRPQIVKEVKTMEGFAQIFKEEGIEQGIEQGSERHLTDQICKKLRRGKDIPQIADEVEEDKVRVKRICDIAERFAPDYDSKQVYDALRKEMAEA